MIHMNNLLNVPIQIVEETTFSQHYLSYESNNYNKNVSNGKW